MPSNVSRALGAIARMPFGSWIDVRAISRDAQLSTYVMANFLAKARREGKVEKRVLWNGANRLHLWRRIA